MSNCREAKDLTTAKMIQLMKRVSPVMSTWNEPKTWASLGKFECLVLFTDQCIHCRVALSTEWCTLFSSRCLPMWRDNWEWHPEENSEWHTRLLIRYRDENWTREIGVTKRTNTPTSWNMVGVRWARWQSNFLLIIVNHIHGWFMVQIPLCHFVLGDRPIEITIGRALGNLSMWQKVRCSFRGER